jgi:NDP-sugar pyrophosphorylase family protein
MIPCVILAGGMGTRISKNFPSTPKALIPVMGKPFIDWKLAQLENQGVTEVYLLTGIGGGEVYNHVASIDLPGLKICMIPDGVAPLGTAGAIKNAAKFLPDYFLLTFGDTLLDERISSFVDNQTLADRPNMLVVTDNVGPSDNLNVCVNDAQITSYSKTSNEAKMNYVDYGYALFNKSVFDKVESASNTDLMVVVTDLITKRLLLAHKTSKSYYEIGTPAGLDRTETYLKSDEFRL